MPPNICYRDGKLQLHNIIAMKKIKKTTSCNSFYNIKEQSDNAFDTHITNRGVIIIDII